MSDCIFCKIANHEIPSTVVYEDDAVIAFDDLKACGTMAAAKAKGLVRSEGKEYVMKDGDIVEQGTHDELIAKNGFYAGLYNSQFEKVS